MIITIWMIFLSSLNLWSFVSTFVFFFLLQFHQNGLSNFCDKIKKKIKIVYVHIVPSHLILHTLKYHIWYEIDMMIRLNYYKTIIDNFNTSRVPKSIDLFWKQFIYLILFLFSFYFPYTLPSTKPITLKL